MKRDFLPESASAVTTAAEGSRLWRHALPLAALVAVWILAWYASTGKTMVDTWARSVTFNHGFVVPPIALWLIWRMRTQLSATVPRPNWWSLAPLAAAGFVWLIGTAAAVNALAQLALTALLVVAVVVVLGTDVARKLAFPLGFLFFAVPVGEFIMPQLMEWTAHFTVLGLRLSGIPVFREGQQFVIPSGSWSVVEACSGLRYLIASLMVGTLFAYLTYRSTTRRLVFVGFAILVPVVANWFRAYMIVMLGHLSNNKLAAGVDHFIYGWLFFGFVIAIMLGVGTRWREDHVPGRLPLTVKPVSISSVPVSRLWLAAAAVALMAVGWKIGYWAIERNDASAPPQLAPLASVGQWVSVTDPVASWQPRLENPSDQLQRTYRNGDQSVSLFMGYYRNQNHHRKLVSSENVLVKSDDPRWRVIGGTRDLSVGGERVSIRTTELRGINEKRITVWQWYWINGRLTANDHWAKAYTALSRLLGQGDDSAVIIVYADDQQPGGSRSAMESFIRAAAPAIAVVLERTRDIR